MSVKRIGPEEVLATYTRGMLTVATSRRTLSEDHRTMTITTTSQDRGGKSTTNIGVYDRVDPPGETTH